MTRCNAHSLLTGIALVAILVLLAGCPSAPASQEAQAKEAPKSQQPPTSSTPKSSATPVATPAATPSEPVSSTAPALFDRVGLIGASATAGFGVTVGVEGPDGVTRIAQGADLGDILRAACRRPVVVSMYGGIFFFNDPVNVGRKAIDRTIQPGLTCVIGVDFLFWYGYGSNNVRGAPLRSEDERLELLEEGLTQLDRIVALGIPVVVGDFPNMEDAVGKMLANSQLPAPKTIIRLNERLAEWASSRPLVRVLSLSTLVPQLDRGDALEMRGRRWSAASDGRMIQSDRLHPTYVGSVAMLAKACELAESCRPDLDAEDRASLCFEPPFVTERILARTQQKRDTARTPTPPAQPVNTPSTPPEAPAAK